MDSKLIINELKKYKGIKTDTDFAAFLGIEQNTLSGWKARNVLNYELIISKVDNIDANWLITGKGEMLRTTQKEEKRPAEKAHTLESIGADLKALKSFVELSLGKVEQRQSATIKQIEDIVSLFYQRGEVVHVVAESGKGKKEPVRQTAKERQDKI